MLNTELVVKSSKDRVPTLNTASLIEAGLLARKPKNGELVNVKLVNSAGIVAEQDFYGSRDGATIYAKEGFNLYLFDLPRIGRGTKVGVCEAAFASANEGYTGSDTDTGRGHATRTRVEGRPTTISALCRLLNRFPTKVAAAVSIGVSTDTLRRLEKKLTAEAEASARKTAPSQSKKSSRGNQKKKAAAPKRGNTYSKTGITKAALEKALKKGKSNWVAGVILGWSADTVRRAKKYFGL